MKQARALSTILIVGCLIVVTACQALLPTVQNNRSGESNKATTTGKSQDAVEIIWYVRTSDSEQPWEREVIRGFETQHTAIKINLVIVPNADFDTKLQTMVAAGTPPDVFSHWGSTGFGDFYKRGLVADLMPFIQRDHYDLSDFIPQVLEIYKINGKIMGLPMLSTGSFVFYNKDLFDAAGVKYPPIDWNDTSWTWDAFIKKCGQLTHRTDDPNNMTFGCNLQLWPLDSYTWIFGENLYPESAYETGFTEKAMLNSEGITKALQSWHDLIWKYKYMPDPAQTNAFGGGDIFKNGKVAMNLSGGWGWWNYQSVSFNWGVAALPYGSSSRRDVIYTDPWLMSSKSQHPNEAWEFIKYLVSPDIQRTWIELTGAPPARQTLMKDWYSRFKMMSPEDVKEVHLGALKYGHTCACDQLVRFDQIDQTLSSSIDPILNNEAPVQEVLPKANEKLEQTLQQIKNQYSK